MSKVPITTNFILAFCLDNDAFQGEGQHAEIAKTVRDVARRVGEGGLTHGKIYDPNGNGIGRFYTSKGALPNGS